MFHEGYFIFERALLGIGNGHFSNFFSNLIFNFKWSLLHRKDSTNPAPEGGEKGNLFIYFAFSHIKSHRSSDNSSSQTLTHAPLYFEHALVKCQELLHWFLYATVGALDSTNSEYMDYVWRRDFSYFLFFLYDHKPYFFALFVAWNRHWSGGFCWAHWRTELFRVFLS